MWGANRQPNGRFSYDCQSFIRRCTLKWRLGARDFDLIRRPRLGRTAHYRYLSGHARNEASVSRNLTDHEREVVLYMLDTAKPFPGDTGLSSTLRERLREQASSALAGPRCACGMCPSIEIEDQAGASPLGGKRIVLSAATPQASVLLFVDAGRLSYLELAPHGDEPIHEFPPVEDLITD